MNPQDLWIRIIADDSETVITDSHPVSLRHQLNRFRKKKPDFMNQDLYRFAITLHGNTVIVKKRDTTVSSASMSAEETAKQEQFDKEFFEREEARSTELTDKDLVAATRRPSLDLTIPKEEYDAILAAARKAPKEEKP